MGVGVLDRIFPSHDSACRGVMIRNIITSTHIITTSLAATSTTTPTIIHWPSIRFIMGSWPAITMVTWASTKPLIAFTTTCPWVDRWRAWNRRWRSGFRSWFGGRWRFFRLLWFLRLLRFFGLLWLLRFFWFFRLLWWFRLFWHLDLNALDSLTSFAADLVLDLFRTAANHSDCHCACLRVIYLVVNLRDFTQHFLDLLAAFLTFKINPDHHCCDLFCHGLVFALS